MRKDLLKKYGRLTTISEENIRIKNKSRRKVFCVCDCGKEVYVEFSALDTGNTKSCGCLKKETTSSVKSTHRMSKSVEYDTWCSIKSRCCNKRNADYKFYGAKGIEMCDRWLESFENFYEDMGERPSGGHSIDRINSEGGYYPENCRWATKKEQARNQSNNKIIEYKDKKYTLIELSEVLFFDYRLVAERLRNNWDLISAIEAPKYTTYKSYIKNKK